MPEQDPNPLAYCGLDCPKCYKTVVSGAAQSLKDALENTAICGSKNDPSQPFKDELNNLISLRCPKVCKAGGGNPACQIRICCREKNIVGCWECGAFQTCAHLTPQFVVKIKEIRNK